MPDVPDMYDYETMPQLEATPTPPHYPDILAASLPVIYGSDGWVLPWSPDLNKVSQSALQEILGGQCLQVGYVVRKKHHGRL